MKVKYEKPFFLKKREYSPIVGVYKSESLKALCRFLSRYGASERTMEDRIRYRGFQEWESRGIASILAKELNIQQPLPGENVYEALSPEQRRNLIAIMADSGMCANTTRHRFSCINFAEWEMIGINKLREQFIAEVNGNSIEQ